MNFKFRTKLRPEEIRDRLREITEPARILRINHEKEFEGTVEERRFRIWKIIRFRKNRPLIEIWGEMRILEDITEINVSLHPDLTTVILFGFAAFLLLAILIPPLKLFAALPASIIAYLIWAFGAIGGKTKYKKLFDDRVLLPSKTVEEQSPPAPPSE